MAKDKQEPDFGPNHRRCTAHILLMRRGEFNRDLRLRNDRPEFMVFHDRGFERVLSEPGGRIIIAEPCESNPSSGAAINNCGRKARNA